MWSDPNSMAPPKPTNQEIAELKAKEQKELHTRIAIQAMNGLLAGRRSSFLTIDAKEFAEKSIVITDALFAELNKRQL